MVRRAAGAVVRNPARIKHAVLAEKFNRIYHPRLGYTTTDNMTTLVVATDGSYSPVIQGPRNASYGVYFGRNSPYNRCASLTSPRLRRMSSGLAEYMGIYYAVDILSKVILPGQPDIRNIIFMFDNQDIGWALGNKNSNRRIYGEMGRRMVHRQLRHLEISQLVKVRLYWTPREDNRDADRLANVARQSECLDIGIAESASSPDKSWSLSNSYNSTDESIRKEIHLVLRRLEFPLVEDDAWTSSIRHFIMNRLSYQALSIPENESIEPERLWGELKAYYWLPEDSWKFKVPPWASVLHLEMWRMQFSLRPGEPCAYIQTWDELQLWRQEVPLQEMSPKAKLRLEKYAARQGVEDLRPSIRTVEDSMTKEELLQRETRSLNKESWQELARWRENMGFQLETRRSKQLVEKLPLKQVVQALRPSFPMAVPLVQKGIIGSFEAIPATLPGYQGKRISQHR